MYSFVNLKEAVSDQKQKGYIARSNKENNSIKVYPNNKSTV